jgi:hypothetical protein
MMSGAGGPLDVARAYHNAWTGGDADLASRYLADGLETDVPLNHYATKDEFLEAVRGVGQLVSDVQLLAEFGGRGEALLLYDLTMRPIGSLRVAEHFVVVDGRITFIRHVHDTAALRTAGFAEAR